MKNVKYFAYGSNMDSKQMVDRDIRFSNPIRAILNGYDLRFNKISSRNSKEGKANIVPEVCGIVEGVLYNIPESDVVKLDGYEGYPEHYGRQSEFVEICNDQKVKAMFYIANIEKTKDGLKPTRLYLSHLLAAKDILSVQYFQKLKQWNTLD